MKSLIEEIKKKKEFSDIPKDLIEELVNNYLNKKNISVPEESKSRKIIIKEIRSELRRYSGQYQHKSHKKRLQLLDETNIEELLKTHSSTKERLDFYSELKELIYSFKPESILDLGCGLNPIAIAKQFVFYQAYDIKKSELDLIKRYFEKNNISGRVLLKDITKIKNFPKADICLILKVLDILGSKEKAKELFKKIKSLIIIVSFSTKTLSGKPMRITRRFWFENFLKKLSYNFRIVRFKNEVFYIVIKTI